jgi:hypothetical protein
MALNPQQFVKEKLLSQVKGVGSVNLNPQDYVRNKLGVIPISTTPLETSQGLYDLAVQSGLKKQADRVVSSAEGESPKKIFSGGFISDIFDTLNALQYEVVGMLKGKGFMEGIKTRQSWSDKDALGNYGIPGMIGGIALDIACDPLTYIAPWTIIENIPGTTDALSAGKKIAEESKIGQWFGRTFVYRFGQDKVYKELAERSIKNIAVGTVNIADMAKGIIDIAPKKAAQLLTKDETGRFIRTSLDKLKGVLTDDELFDVAKNYSILDDLGKQAVDLGLLGKGTWEENLGEYITNLGRISGTQTSSGPASRSHLMSWNLAQAKKHPAQRKNWMKNVIINQSFASHFSLFTIIGISLQR